MVSRVLPRLQTFLPVFVLLLVLGVFPLTIAQARTPYTYTDGTEGDPGDGVLDPSIDSGGGGGGSDGRIPEPVIQSLDTFTWLLPLGDIYLLPVTLPGGTSYYGVFRFSQMIFGGNLASLSLEGRWHDAP